MTLENGIIFKPWNRVTEEDDLSISTDIEDNDTGVPLENEHISATQAV